MNNHCISNMAGISETADSNSHNLHLSTLESGEGNGNPLQCSCLENPMDRGASRARVHGGAKSQT